MAKKLLAFVLACCMIFTLAACNKSDTTAKDDGAKGDAKEEGSKKLTVDDLKVGFIYIGSKTDGGYSQAHDKGRLVLEEKLGVKTIALENVPENASDAEKAIRDLIDQGCNVIYANSFNYEDSMLKVAKEYPDLYFGHATGISQITGKGVENLTNYMGRIYEPRYLSGIAAGMKTTAKKIGYVAAFPTAEVIRGINAFTLGVRSVSPETTVEVLWINSWYDPAQERAAADELLNRGCDVIAQHCDTTGPQVAAQEKGAFAVGYNSPSKDAAPKAYLTAPLFNWGEYYISDVQSILDGNRKSGLWWEGMASGAVELDALSDNCAPGTAEKVEEAKQKIISGDFFVFQGPIKDNEGKERVKAGERMSDKDMYLNFDWFVEGVIGNASGK